MNKGRLTSFFAGIPWSSYLNKIRLNWIYGDHITLDAISRVYNVHANVISSLGRQATVNINQERGRQKWFWGIMQKGKGIIMFA